MKQSRLLPFAFLTALAAVGCNGTTLDQPYTFHTISHGGFLDFHPDPAFDEILIDSATSKLSRRLEEGGFMSSAQLDAAELDAVTKAVEEADFMHLDESYTCTSCSDGGETIHTLVTGGKTYEVAGSGGPDELLALARALRELADEKLPKPIKD